MLFDCKHCNDSQLLSVGTGLQWLPAVLNCGSCSCSMLRTGFACCIYMSWCRAFLDWVGQFDPSFPNPLAFFYCWCIPKPSCSWTKSSPLKSSLTSGSSMHCRTLHLRPLFFSPAHSELILKAVTSYYLHCLTVLTGPSASISIAFLTDNFWKPSKITWKQIWANNSTQTLYKNWKHWKYQVRQHRWKQKVMVHHNNLWSEVSARHAEFSQFPMFLLQNSRICRVYLWGLFFLFHSFIRQIDIIS